MSVDGGDSEEHVYGYLPGSIEHYVSVSIPFCVLNSISTTTSHIRFTMNASRIGLGP